MPRSFLIRKQDESSATRNKLKGMFGFTNANINHTRPNYYQSGVSSLLSAVSVLDRTQKSLSNDDVIVSNPDLTIKKQLYNEFFVLDDPKVWQKYVERQHEDKQNPEETNNNNGTSRNQPQRFLPKLDGSFGLNLIRKQFKGKSEKLSTKNRSQQRNKNVDINMGGVGSDGEQDKTPSATSAGELSPKSNEDQDKFYQCKYCNKSFTRSWNYQRHVLIHTGRKPHKCDKCPKAFVLAAHLKIHNRIHTGEKPYKCNICGRGFAQLTNLQRHVLTHTGEKPHKCTYCGKGFVSSSDLRRHVRIHTGEKPYQCKVCSKAFTTSGNLQSHVLTHTGEKPYQCTICNWKFISSSNLRTHIRTHHYGNGSDKEDITMKSDEDSAISLNVLKIESPLMA